MEAGISQELMILAAGTEVEERKGFIDFVFGEEGHQGGLVLCSTADQFFKWALWYSEYSQVELEEFCNIFRKHLHQRFPSLRD